MDGGNSILIGCPPGCSPSSIWDHSADISIDIVTKKMLSSHGSIVSKYVRPAVIVQKIIAAFHDETLRNIKRFDYWANLSYPFFQVFLYVRRICLDGL